MTVSELINTLIALPEELHQREVVIFAQGQLDFPSIAGTHLLNDGRIELATE